VTRRVRRDPPPPATTVIETSPAQPFVAQPLAVTLPLVALRESPLNPRRRVDPDRLKELTASVAIHGVLEPLLVRPYTGNGDANYEVVAGARRFRAAAAAGLLTVPAIVSALNDEEVLEFSLIENLQRDDLSPMEQARGFQALIEANPTKHTPGSIAGRVGMAERWVWERLKLLDLTKAAQQHLDHGRITVGHAIRLARLKPADQARALEHGVFEPEGPTLDLVHDLHAKKAVSLRELDAWIATHVRFDPQHAGAAAPLEFGEVAARVEHAKEVVPITYEHMIPADVRDADARTYTPQTWKRADGEAGSKSCASAVLGVVAVGRDYGTAFNVCVDKSCDVHWKRERLARAKAKTADPDERDATKTRQLKREIAAEEAKTAARQAWTNAVPAITTAIGAALNKAPIARIIDLLLKEPTWRGWIPTKTPPPRNADRCLRLLAFAACRAQIDRWDANDHFPRVAKTLGVNTAALLKP
jgi:ParB/RepB/Spo0J family partition protein